MSSPKWRPFCLGLKVFKTKNCSLYMILGTVSRLRVLYWRMHKPRKRHREIWHQLAFVSTTGEGVGILAAFLVQWYGWQMWLGYNQYAGIEIVADKLHKTLHFIKSFHIKASVLCIPALISTMENSFCFEITSGPYSRRSGFDCQSKNDDACFRTIWFLRLHLADFWQSDV